MIDRIMGPPKPYAFLDVEARTGRAVIRFTLEAYIKIGKERLGAVLKEIDYNKEDCQFRIKPLSVKLCGPADKMRNFKRLTLDMFKWIGEHELTAEECITSMVYRSLDSSDDEM